MRVIAGKYKKRQLKVPKSQLTRPTTDKNKENLFFILNFKEILTTKNARKVNFQACLL